MVKQFQVGKRYRFIEPIMGFKEETYLVLYIFPNGNAAVDLYRDTTFLNNCILDNSLLPELKIVPPKPRTGEAFIYKLHEDKSLTFAQIFQSRPSWYTAKKYEEIPIAWTEILKDA